MRPFRPEEASSKPIKRLKLNIKQVKLAIKRIKLDIKQVKLAIKRIKLDIKQVKLDISLGKLGKLATMLSRPLLFNPDRKLEGKTTQPQRLPKMEMFRAAVLGTRQAKPTST
jgi:hypothetical protein